MNRGLLFLLLLFLLLLLVFPSGQHAKKKKSKSKSMSKNMNKMDRMNKLDLPVVRPASADAKDVAGLQAALAHAMRGEVRCDRLSRALYSTDASVYQIVPLGVVVPRTEAEVVETIRISA